MRRIYKSNEIYKAFLCHPMVILGRIQGLWGTDLTNKAKMAI